MPGKVILLGEHAVLCGHPAIATAVPRRLTLVAELGQDAHDLPGDRSLRQALVTTAVSFGLDPCRVAVHTESRLPPGGGLGSSAALSVALVRAVAALSCTELTDTEVMRLATEVEHAFHRRSSGLDIRAVVHTGPIWFEPGAEPLVLPLDVREPFDLVIAQSGQRRSTAAQVDAVGHRPAQSNSSPGPMARLGELTRRARAALADGEVADLGDAMNSAHLELRDLGMSTPTLDRMVAIAREAGAAGAKLTGAGHGGAMIAVAGARGPRICTALRDSGFEVFLTRMNRSEPEDATNHRN
ncbi:mevalonate kinase [Kitasatospora sp. NPDC048540]|uniref:mevalonate kinase n=1 Tax=unclassified Kitasatospora TaxID=2633591 RepID=UPI0013141169|nr:mevalonate kinase [Kitasatospora sp. MBT63]